MSQLRCRWNALHGGLVWAACSLLFLVSGIAAQERVREPLTVDTALSFNEHSSHSVLDFSPDGQWLAHTWVSGEGHPEHNGFTATGVSDDAGFGRKQATLTNVKTGQVILLGGASSSSWAPVWSPDGNRVAYYSDEGGEAGVWIWEKATGKSQRFPGVIARAFFGFEIVRWSSDNQHILCKILPEGMNVAQANALGPQDESSDRFPKVGPHEASVIVFKSPEKKSDASYERASWTGTAKWTNKELGDLALLDLRAHTVTRIAKSVRAQWWAFSPDNRYLAFTDLLGLEPNTEQIKFELVLYVMATGQRRTLASTIHLIYGMELNWSPDSTRIAYSDCGTQATGGIVVVSVTDGAAKTFSGANLPSLTQSGREHAPLWDGSGRNLYALADGGKVWKVEVVSGRGTVVGDIAEHRVTDIVARAGTPTIWTTDGGRTAWVIAQEREGTKAGIFRVDVETGQSTPALEDDRKYENVFDLDASDATGAIGYVAEDQQHPADVWIYDTAASQTHQVTHLNQEIEHHELGAARVIDWYGDDGQKLRGSLLLPPGYQKGQRVPLVVWVYGGSYGSRSINSFGLGSGGSPAFNFHILATRGYAVFFPDTPLRDGLPMHDLMSTVMPGVNAVITEGYADPDRLAVMGQSYGSYCTLALISQTKRFKAAIITAAVLHSDLVADYLNAEPETPDSHVGYYEQGQGNLHGTPWEQRDRYLANSPIYLFDQVETPLLIGQGSTDSFGHNLLPSDATFAALKRLGKEVEYRIYKDEGHVLTSKQNVIDFWDRRLHFLAQHLNLTTDAKGAIVFDGDHVKLAKPN